LISCFRDPRSWYASARRHDPEEFGDLDSAATAWCHSAQAMLDARKEFSERVFLVAFEDLVAETERTMRKLASWLDIPFHPSLLVPTFNGLPIKANSSFQVGGYGVLTDPLSRHTAELSTDEQKAIGAATASLQAALVASKS
jgi:hypothetical protein